MAIFGKVVLKRVMLKLNEQLKINIMRIRNNQLFYFFLIILSIQACSKKENTPALTIGNTDNLDKILDDYVENDFYPFIYARLEDLDGNVLYEHSSVNNDLLPNTKIDGDSWIRIWSMSKIVTISTVLDLIEDGLLKIDDPVAKYIPEFENLKVAISDNGTSLLEIKAGEGNDACPVKLVTNDSVMTVKHLINHQAGFYYATTGFPCIDSLIVEQNLPMAKNSDELINKMANLLLIQHSGTDYFYGTNTTVLGLVAE